MDKQERLGNYDILQKTKIGGVEVAIGCDPSQEKCYCVMNVRTVMDGLYRTGTDLMQTADYLQAFQEYIHRQQHCLDQCRKAQIDKTVLTGKACLPESNRLDYTGEVVVISAGYFAPEYRNAANQLVYVQGGNGAKPEASGTKVFVQGLSDGEKFYCRRNDVLGIIRPEAMPQWASKKLQQLKQKHLEEATIRKQLQKTERR